MEESAGAVRHNLQQSRFEARVGDGLAVAQYQRSGDVLVFTHTEVPPEAQGEGVGDRLARAGMEYAQEEGLKVRAECRFIAAWLGRHSEYDDLRER